MPSTSHEHGAYDANLLAAAPAATKQQLQSGYTTDLLDEKVGRPHSSRRQNDLESGQAYRHDPAATKTSSSPSHTPPVAPPPPFYRTAKGRIIIAIGLLLILGAIIGGAVGGTVGNKKSNTLSSNGPTTTETGQGGVATGPATTQGVASPGNPTASATPSGPAPSGLASGINVTGLLGGPSASAPPPAAGTQPAGGPGQEAGAQA